MKARRFPRYPRLALTALVFWPALASADFNLSFGVRWEPMRYTVPQVPTKLGNGGVDVAQPGAGGTATLPSSSSFNAFQRQDFNGYVGLGFTDKFTLTLGVDFARATLGHTYSDPDGSTPTSRAFNTFGINVGLKWNFVAPKKEKLSPYVYADFFKYFTALNDDRPDNLQQNEVEYSASLAAPMGFRVAFGIEYYFNESFGIGAEIFGIQGAFSSGSLSRRENMVQVSHEQSLNTISFYTALTLTFRFPSLVKYGASRRYRERDDRD